MSLAVILVHYHTPQLLAGAVEALLADLKGSGLQGELVVVDNGSRAEDQALLEGLPVRLLKPGANLGYAGGINLGLASTEADHLVLMNPDVIVLPGSLKALTDELRQGAAAAGPRFFWDRAKTFLLPLPEERTRGNELLRLLALRGGTWSRLARARWRRHARRHWLASQPMVSQALSGALLALTRRSWEEVGPFDEGYKLYFEETDWLLRLRSKGLKSLYVPQAQVVHLYNQSAGAEPSSARWFADSAQRFNRRHYGWWFTCLLKALNRLPGNHKINSLKLPPGLPQLRLDQTNGNDSRPLWIELSQAPQGYPAAASIVHDPVPKTWRFPENTWSRLTPDEYSLLMVDNAGRELAGFSFIR
jgi:N-acetylglucosaminyl-diphospho-decaprenol L-rhamnosyltransferase